MKAMTPITMPMKQASRDKIMKARVASQYANEGTQRASLARSPISPIINYRMLSLHYSS